MCIVKWSVLSARLLQLCWSIFVYAHRTHCSHLPYCSYTFISSISRSCAASLWRPSLCLHAHWTAAALSWGRCEKNWLTAIAFRWGWILCKWENLSGQGLGVRSEMPIRLLGMECRLVAAKTKDHTQQNNAHTSYTYGWYYIITHKPFLLKGELYTPVKATHPSKRPIVRVNIWMYYYIRAIKYSTQYFH